MLLGVNIDHIATLRQARGTPYPDPVEGAFEAIAGGADFITLHLREDRRHIQDADVATLREQLPVRMNLEMAVTDEMVEMASRLKPADCCLVPERREELTTEGGLDVAGQLGRVTAAVHELSAVGCRVSLFIDADRRQVEAAYESGAPVVELHTGHFADAAGAVQVAALKAIKKSAGHAADLGLSVNAGHGLHRDNVSSIAAIAGIAELNIGHAIIARALFVGLRAAVGEVREAMHAARPG